MVKSTVGLMADLPSLVASALNGHAYLANVSIYDGVVCSTCTISVFLELFMFENVYYETLGKARSFLSSALTALHSITL